MSIIDVIVTLISVMFLLWPMYVIVGIFVIIKLAFAFWEKSRLAKSGVAEIDRMDGKTFEKYLEVLFGKLGYRVERTRYVGDYGADLVAKKNGVKYVIQAKRHKSKIGVKAIQEVVAAKGYYHCDEALVVTNSFFTGPAINLAKANNVELWNRNVLVNKLLSIKNELPNIQQQQPSNQQIVRPGTVEDIISASCAQCGKKVSDRVKNYCLSNTNKFAGKVYCYDHQKRLSAVK